MAKQLGTLVTPGTSTPGDLASAGAGGVVPAEADHAHAREDWHNTSPAVSQTITANQSITLTGLPLILAAGVLYSIAAGAVVVINP